MLSVPYSVELNDLGAFLLNGFTGPDFVRLVKDQLDKLYDDADGNGRVIALALHPFVIGQPSRYRYLEQALDHISGHEGIWLTTSDDIAAHYRGSADRPA